MTAPDNEDILFKDSVYTAIGLAADVLHDQLDFNARLQHHPPPYRYHHFPVDSHQNREREEVRRLSDLPAPARYK
jgi:hypothetical protein